MPFKMLSRRWFLKTMSMAGVAFWGTVGRLWSQATTDIPAVDLRQMVAALGDTIIPTAEGYPGYRRLEPYGITDEVLKGLQGMQPQEFAILNAAASNFFDGRPFVDLAEAQRTEFLQMVVESFPEGSFVLPEPRAQQSLASALPAEAIETIQKVFRLVRIRVFTLFYQNFPNHRIARDKNRIPVTDDPHQIINPNTTELVTGWDVANFPGPLSWAEEEQRRARWMSIHWHSETGA